MKSNEEELATLQKQAEQVLFPSALTLLAIFSHAINSYTQEQSRIEARISQLMSEELNSGQKKNKNKHSRPVASMKGFAAGKTMKRSNTYNADKPPVFIYFQ
jgi:hypothetical protein